MPQIKNLLKPIAFTVLLGTCVYFLTQLFVPKNDSSYQWMRAPYFERENSLDVVFVGSSHVEWGIDPNYIWENFGIPSINYTVQSIDLKNTYFLLEELLKYQRPKVIVIDIFRIALTDERSEIALTNRMSNTFRPSLNKLRMINSNERLDNFSKRIDYYFPLHLYHSRKLEAIDFDFSYHNIEKGHYLNFDQSNETPGFNEVFETISLDSSKRQIVERIMRFSKENDIPIFFIKIPI